MKYESECRYIKMSTAKFLEEVCGIKLRWYQRLLMRIMDIRDKFEKRYIPHRYYYRYFRK